MRVQNPKFICGLFLFCCLIFTACGSPPPPSGNTPEPTKVEPRTIGTRGGTLTYRLTSAPKTFNYVMAADEVTIVGAFTTLTSRLVDFDHESQEYVPSLAESWKTAADGLTADVKLREGLKFSDGKDLTTDDVIFSLAAIYDEKTKAPAYRDAMLVDGKEIVTKRINEREMQMVFPKPVASTENYLVNLAVLPAHVLEADLKAGKFAEAWKINSPPASIVSSGPFIVESAAPGERIEYVRNPHYWKKDAGGTQLPYIDKLVIEILPDANNTFVRLSQGTLDFADRIRPTDFTELTKAAGPMRAIDVGPG
ncbi:MAG: ABC transporter substrate-binding protein, partial [Pyrinomonadaceae bacterium]